MSRVIFASKERNELALQVSKIASMANKRLVRLRGSGLQDSPAYKKWVDSGAQKFSVKGKDYNELQKELARVRQFVNATTSTVRGATNVLKTIADNTGIKYKTVKEIMEKSAQFFRLADKIEEYLRLTEQSASAIGYQKIWESINVYVQQEKIDLGNLNLDIDKLTEKISVMTKYEIVVKGHEGYSIDGTNFEYF